MKKIASISAFALVPLLAFSAVAYGVTSPSVAQADTMTYKQSFSEGSTAMGSVFNIAGDESSISYSLDGETSGNLVCQASNGSWITAVSVGSGSGTISASSITPQAQNCSPNIFTLPHLIQAMREGKIYVSLGGINSQLMNGSSLMIATTTSPVDTGSGSATSTSGTSTGTTTGTTTTGTGDMGGTTGTTTTATSTDGVTGSMGSTGSTTSATSTMGTGTSTGTTGMPAASSTMTAAANLRVTLNNLLREHVTASLDVLHAISDNNPAAMNGAMQEQDQNAVDLAAAVGSVYGTDAGNTFLQYFRAHITASNAYTIGLKDGSITDQQTALNNLDLQLQNLAHFFANANPNISYDGLLAALRQHEVLVNTSSQDYQNGDYTDAYAVERQALTQISGGADVLANAIVMQYPTLFTQ